MIVVLCRILQFEKNCLGFQGSLLALMLHIERPASLGVSLSMPLSTRVVLPVSALEQMSLSHSHSNHNRHSPSPQGEDMVTDKDQAASQVSDTVY